jgi:hypothetical protein
VDVINSSSKIRLRAAHLTTWQLSDSVQVSTSHSGDGDIGRAEPDFSAQGTSSHSDREKFHGDSPQLQPGARLLDLLGAPWEECCPVLGRRDLQEFTLSGPQAATR